MQEKVNKIIQADCLEYLRSLPDGRVECVLIDEPYGVLTGHKIEEGYNLDIAKQIRVEAMRVLKKDGWFIFFGQFPTAWDFGRITMEVGFKPWQQCNEIVWCKRILSSPFQKLARIHENIFVFQKGKPQTYENKAPCEDITIDNAFHGIANFETIKRYIAFLKSGKEKPQNLETSKKNDEFYNFNKNNIPRNKNRFQENINIPSIWSFCKENQMHRSNHNITHPTVKPTLLFRRLIKLFTQEGDTVLDCFAGSGTTALASVQEGRNFLCCERDEGYVKIANDRLANWQDDLTRQDKWLNERGVVDFESDIKDEKSDIQGSLF